MMKYILQHRYKNIYIMYTSDEQREIDYLKLTNEMKLAVNDREFQTSVMQVVKKRAIMEHLQLGL